MTRIILTICCLLLISCGKAVEDKEELDPEEETYSDGTYLAILIPVNGRVSSHIDGEVKVSRYGDEFQVKVNLKNAPAGLHKQYLHTGTDCPRNEHDDNRDGFVDGYEAREAMGSILIPFDGDLSSQNRGDTFFPSGTYQYARSTSYYLMLSDLHLPDDIVNDSMVKLNEREVPLERRAVSIYGKSAVGDIPIACGILTRITDIPTPGNDTWEEREPLPRNPIPVPRPRPNPRPAPVPEPDDDHRGGSWWDHLRQRWERWRSRMQDWWNGSDD